MSISVCAADIATPSPEAGYNQVGFDHLGDDHHRSWTPIGSRATLPFLQRRRNTSRTQDVDRLDDDDLDSSSESKVSRAAASPWSTSFPDARHPRVLTLLSLSSSLLPERDAGQSRRPFSMTFNSFSVYVQLLLISFSLTTLLSTAAGAPLNATIRFDSPLVSFTPGWRVAKFVGTGQQFAFANGQNEELQVTLPRKCACSRCATLTRALR